MLDKKIVGMVFIMSDGVKCEATADEFNSCFTPHNAESVILIAEDGEQSTYFIDGLGR